MYINTHRRVKSQSSLNFLVDDDVHFDATLCCSFEHVVQTISLILGGRTAEIELRAKPPVQNEDAFPSL